VENRVRGWEFIAVGLGLGLYASRLVAELWTNGWPPVVLLFLIGVGATAGINLFALLRRLSLHWTPLLTLWGYVFWPRINFGVAAGAGFVAIAATVLLNIRRSADAAPSARREWLAGALTDTIVFLAAYALYRSTLAPTVLPADAGEFQLVARVLGVAHPPGYPLYTLLAACFARLPLATDVAARVSLLSAVTGALTLAVVSRTARRLTGSTLGGLAAALTLGVSTTFWAQSTTANIRSLTVLFTALCIHTLVVYADEHKPTSLLAFAVALGFGIAHHGSLAFFIPVFVAVILLCDPSPFRQRRFWPKFALAFLSPFLVMLYVPIRAWTGAPFGTGELVSFARVVDHLLGKGFSGDMFYYLGSPLLAERFRILGDILLFQFGGPLLAIAGLGAALLAWQRPRVALLLSGVFAIMGFIVATYRAPQSVEYFMPAYVPVALAVGSATGWLARWRTGLPAVNALAVAAVLLMAVGLGTANYPDYFALSQDTDARDYATSLLNAVPANAVILANWHWATPLWYLQQVEGQRPDVEVAYVHPEGVPYAQTWARRIGEEIGKRPVVVTNFYQDFGALPYRFVPLGEAFLVQEGPVYESPPGLTLLQVTFGDQVSIVGYRVQKTTLSPGGVLTVDLCWGSPVALEQPIAFFIHLVDEAGQPVGQGDVSHPDAPEYVPGEMRVDRFVIPVLTTVSPGTYRLVTGVYIPLPGGGWRRLTTPDGAETVQLEQVEVTPGTESPLTLHPLHHPTVGGPTLVGVDYDTTLVGQRRVYLHWQQPSYVQETSQAVLYAGFEEVARLPLPQVPAGTSFTVACDLPLEMTALRLEVRTAAGEQRPWLGPWSWPLSGRLILPKSPAESHYVPLDGGMIFLGANVAPEPWLAGSVQRVAVHWLGVRPLLRDYDVSISLADGAGGWFTQHDSVPALGAVPTLKWLQGSRVTDAHFVPVPEDAAPGTATLRLTVYDAFTLRPLTPLDERITRLGLGAAVPLGEVAVGQQ
jgi:4-amino-4-deoxy-L-arabinose transferase-like glycosyltransferase